MYKRSSRRIEKVTLRDGDETEEFFLEIAGHHLRFHLTEDCSGEPLLIVNYDPVGKRFMDYSRPPAMNSAVWQSLTDQLYKLFPQGLHPK